LPDELPARKADRDALLHAGDIEGVPPDLGGSVAEQWRQPGQDFVQGG
jgi:hypothetical protein